MCDWSFVEFSSPITSASPSSSPHGNFFEDLEYHLPYGASEPVLTIVPLLFRNTVVLETIHKSSLVDRRHRSKSRHSATEDSPSRSTRHERGSSCSSRGREREHRREGSAQPSDNPFRGAERAARKLGIPENIVKDATSSLPEDGTWLRSFHGVQPDLCTVLDSWDVSETSNDYVGQQQVVDRLRQRYEFPGHLGLKAPGKKQRVCFGTDLELPIYEHMLEFRVKFPLKPFFVALCNSYLLAPMQLLPPRSHPTGHWGMEHNNGLLHHLQAVGYLPHRGPLPELLPFE